MPGGSVSRIESSDAGLVLEFENVSENSTVSPVSGIVIAAAGGSILPAGATSFSSSRGFVTAGTPTVYLQAPDGKVLHRQDNYSPGDFQAIRKAIDKYDAKRDPDVRQASAPVSLPAFATPANIILGGLIAAVVALYVKQRKATI